MANVGSKRDKDEIDILRKQLTELRGEVQQKDKYSKAQIDRLARQVADFRQENQELRDEISQYDQQLMEARENKF